MVPGRRQKTTHLFWTPLNWCVPPKRSAVLDGVVLLSILSPSPLLTSPLSSWLHSLTLSFCVKQSNTAQWSFDSLLVGSITRSCFELCSLQDIVQRRCVNPPNAPSRKRVWIICLGQREVVVTCGAAWWWAPGLVQKMKAMLFLCPPSHASQLAHTRGSVKGARAVGEQTTLHSQHHCKYYVPIYVDC